MPKRYGKKRGRRSRRRTNRKMVIRKSPMPLRFPTKLRYVENFTMDGAASGLADAYVFNAGGLYDPNITGVGHQPRGWDQLIAMYDHAVVIGSKITLTITHNSSGAVNEICGVALRDGSTVDTDPNDYLEGGTVRSGHITADKPTKMFTLGYSPKKFLGRSKPMADSTLKNSVSANPTESAFFHCFTAGLGGTNPAAVDCTAVIDYLCVFIEPKDVAQS